MSNDAFGSYEAVIASRPLDSPWRTADDGSRQFVSDDSLLEQLIAIPVGDAASSQSGRLAKAIDAWIAQELRRAGFDENEVWPKLYSPRVVPREVALFIDGLPKNQQVEARRQLAQNKRVAPDSAKILGRAFVKQVDVVIAQWARGPELLVSTKSMVASFRKNLPNRFEESYGDAKNLRGRYPLVALGFFFVLRSTALDEPGTIERAIDMLRKLRVESDAYDITGLVVAEWTDAPDFDGVTLRNEVVPTDLRASEFLGVLINKVLENTPIDMHTNVRNRRDQTQLTADEFGPNQ